MRLIPILALAFFYSSCSSTAPGMIYTNCTPESLGSGGHLPIELIEITPNLIDDVCCETCSLPEPFTGDFRKSHYQYRVGPYDNLSIMVWGHPDLNNPTNATAKYEQLGFVVNSEGKIFYPYVGEVDVAGKTVDQIREVLSERLSAWVKDPNLNVRVLEYRSQFVNVMGEVNQPCIVPLKDVPTTLIDAIDRAGGATYRGDLKNVVLLRNGMRTFLNIHPKNIDFRLTLLNLEHGDILYVPSRNNNQVYVLGEVIEPQSVEIAADDINLSQAIAQAGGVNPLSSNPAKIFVFREGPCGEKLAYHLNAASPESMILASQFPLCSKDIVFVGTYHLALWNRIVTNFLSTTRAIADLSWAARSLDQVINDQCCGSYDRDWTLEGE